jgi:hypothetical protein
MIPSFGDVLAKESPPMSEHLDPREPLAAGSRTLDKGMNSSSLNATIHLLADIASRHLGATAWATWSLDPTTETLFTDSSGGGALPHSPFLVSVCEARMVGESGLLCYPLRATGSILGRLELLVPGRVPANDILSTVDQFVASIKSSII